MLSQGGAKELFLNSSAELPGPTMAERLADPGSFLQLGANITALLGFWTILRQMLPFEYIHRVRDWMAPYFDRFNRYAYYEIQENVGQTPNELFDAVQAHLSLATARTAHRASLIKSKGAAKISYTMSTGSDWTMENFQGHPMWWKFSQYDAHSRRLGDYYGQPPEEAAGSFTLKIHKKQKGKILDDYMDHIMINAKKVKQVNRERQLYTNSGGVPWRSRLWASIPLKHPSSFDTLALDPGQKAEVLDDLTEFVKSEAFYKRVGRAWKRGYLLYGPPGTGKSSMIAAMANFLNYDIYDLELTQVANNTELRKLLLQTTSKSIIVIEDIDCSIDLTNRAKEDKKEEEKKKKKESKKKDGVTLSGLLNFTDGIWSCCGSEKIIIFTTNHIKKLDPALLRTGRMDMKIHLSFCQFPAFKVLAKNYLGIEHHEMYDQVEEAMEGAHMTPADVAEYLINSNDAETALTDLIAALERNKLQPLPNEDDEVVVSGEEIAGEGDSGGTGSKNADEAHAQETKDHGEASAGDLAGTSTESVAAGTGESHAPGQRDDVEQEHSKPTAEIGNAGKSEAMQETTGAEASSESTAAQMLGT